MKKQKPKQPEPRPVEIDNPIGEVTVKLYPIRKGSPMDFKPQWRSCLLEKEKPPIDIELAYPYFILTDQSCKHWRRCLFHVADLVDLFEEKGDPVSSPPDAPGPDPRD